MYNPTLYVPNFPLAFFVSCVLVRDALLPLLHFITGDFFLLNYCPCKTHCRTTGRACGFLLVLKNIYENKKDDIEKVIAGCDISGHESEIPCITEGVAFMSDKTITRMVNHPYVKSSPETHFHFRDTKQYPLYHKNP